MSNTTSESGNKRKSLGRGLGSLISEAGVSGGQSNIPQQKPVVQDPGAMPKPAVENPMGASPNSLGEGLPEAGKVDTVKAGASPASAPAAAPSGLLSESRVWTVPIEKLSPSRYQPRQTFDPDKLDELAQSIKGQGILQPIVARKITENSFEIIAGERRWRAAQLAGLRDVPVIIKTLSNKETLELAIIENVQREDLNPIEEAEAYLRLSQEFGLNHQQIADRVGKERATVANALRLLALPTEIRTMVLEGSITQGHAKVILSLSEADQMVRAARKALDEGLSVRQLEKVVHAYKNLQFSAQSQPSAATLSEKLALELADELQKKLGTKVVIDYRSGKGKITIQFYSDAELNSISERLRS